MANKLVRFLVISERGDGRVISRLPSKLKPREFCFRLDITMPARAPIVSGSVSLTVPEWPASNPAIEFCEAMAEEYNDNAAGAIA